MSELTIQELEFTIGEMKVLQKEHPKARILFDAEKRRIDITYPLPQDLIRHIKYKSPELLK